MQVWRTSGGVSLNESDEGGAGGGALGALNPGSSKEKSLITEITHKRPCRRRTMNRKLNSSPPPPPDFTKSVKYMYYALNILHEIMYKMSLIERVMINTGNFESKRRTHKSTRKAVQRGLSSVPPKTGMTKKGV